MTKFEFQTGDKVLARYDDEDKWEFHHFSHKEGDEFSCDGWTCGQCIPYNETTKHLCGTSDPYIGPAEAPAFEFGDVIKWKDEDGNLFKGIFSHPHNGGYWGEAFVEEETSTRTFYMETARLIRKGNFND